MIPSGNDKYSVRIVEIAVAPVGQPLFSEMATRISIDDEAAGEFVKVTQERGHTDYAKSITIDSDEWPVLRDAIEYMIGECRSE